jgi:CheY-like chemotaxis protein
MPSREKLILLVEDSVDDVFFFKRSIDKAGLKNPVHVLQSVDDAICYLDGRNEFANREHFPLPSIIVVDLHVPGKDGFELLKWLGDKAQLRSLHVIVLTGIGRMEDINRAYQMGANSFLTKPIKDEDLKNLAAAYAACWG